MGGNTLDPQYLPDDVPVEEEVTEEVIEEEVAEEPAEEAEAEPAAESEASVDETPDADELQGDIDKLTRLRDERKKRAREAAYWKRQELKATAASPQPAQQEPEPATVAAQPRPREEDFEDYEQYQDAVVDWKVDQKLIKERKEREAREASAQYQNREQGLYDKLDRGFEKHNDFDIVFQPQAPITPLIKDCLMEVENPEDVAYYLCKHPTEAVRIGRLRSPLAAAREIAKIETQLSETSHTPTTTRKVTQAPAPIKPVGGASEVAEDPEKMSMTDYRKWAAKNPNLKNF